MIGTNQGDLQSNIEEAIERIKKAGIIIKKKSRISKTKAWGFSKQPDFLNIVLEGEVKYEPPALLSVIKTIEQDLGRKADTIRWGPRIIDIDILFYDDRVIKTKELIVPHEQFLNRPFAIKLMADIAPTFIHPCTHRQVRDYMESCI